jgi:hypothetical protein
VVEAALFVGLLLWTPAFILGLRPSRHDRPTRMLVVLTLWSIPVLMAGWALADEKMLARFRWALSDSEGLAVAVMLGLALLGGTVLLLPAWGYAIGRTVNWCRWRTAQAVGRGSRAPDGSPPFA